MDPNAWNVVGDLPGGTRQAMFGWAKYADVLAVVVEPTPKSIHVARRLLNISKAEWLRRTLSSWPTESRMQMTSIGFRKRSIGP